MWPEYNTQKKLIESEGILELKFYLPLAAGTQ